MEPSFGNVHDLNFRFVSMFGRLCCKCLLKLEIDDLETQAMIWKTQIDLMADQKKLH